MIRPVNLTNLSSPRQRWDQRYLMLPAEARTEPTPFVRACLPRLPIQGWALDVAAGAGRHTLALAQRGLQVDAVDISWHGLRLAQQRASKMHLKLGEQIRFIVADLERPWLPSWSYHVILVSFFLHRPLFPLIKDRLLPGGWLVYETFTVKQTHGYDQQPIRLDFLLKPDELRNAFADFDILFYHESDHDDRATAQLLARKPME